MEQIDIESEQIKLLNISNLLRLCSSNDRHRYHVILYEAPPPSFLLMS